MFKSFSFYKSGLTKELDKTFLFFYYLRHISSCVINLRFSPLWGRGAIHVGGLLMRRESLI